MSRKPNYKCLICGEFTLRNDGHNRYCSNCYIDLFERNFYELKLSGKQLTYKGFNEVSRIKSMSYVTLFKRTFDYINTWSDVLKYFNKYDEVVDYICDEYVKYNKNSDDDNLMYFVRKHPYAGDTFCRDIGIDVIKERTGTKVFKRRDEFDLIDEYKVIKAKINKIPLFNEFFKHASFTNTTLCQRYGGYEKFIENCFPEDYNEFKILRKQNKREIAQSILTGRHFETDEEIILKFKGYIQDYVKTYNELPTIKIIEKLNNVDFKHFRKRTGLSLEILVSQMGYDPTKLKSFNRSENACLNHVSVILNTSYEPQKVFPWLRGIFDFPLFCDGYYPEYNLILEFNGVQHYKPVERFGGIETFKILQQNDQRKKELCEEHGIKFLIIKSCQPWYKEEWLTKKLKQEGIL